MVGLPGLRWSGQIRTMIDCPISAMLDSDFAEGMESESVEGY